MAEDKKKKVSKEKKEPEKKDRRVHDRFEDAGGSFKPVDINKVEWANRPTK